MAGINKYLDKVIYFLFVLSLDLTFLIIKGISVLIFNAPSKKIKGDLILYPYAFIGSDGYTRRFLEYLPFLDKEGIKYRLCPVFSDAYARRQLNSHACRRYIFYLKVLWKRIPQVIAARHYRAAFIQRGLFPVYFDLEYPHLERLLRKVNSHITLDIWDSIFERQTILVNETINYVDQLSLSNAFLMNHFSDFTGKRILWKIAVNLSKYKIKNDYSLHDKVRLIWTGLPHNLPSLKKHLPVFRDVSRSYPLILVIVCQQPLHFEGLEIEHHVWDENTFFDLLPSADIGVYPEFDRVISRGKSTMKVMDYFSAALPMIGVPFGLPAEAADNRELMVAEGYDQWKQKLELLIQDAALRRKLGTNGRSMMERYYSLSKSYELFRTFALATDNYEQKS